MIAPVAHITAGDIVEFEGMTFLVNYFAKYYARVNKLTVTMYLARKVGLIATTDRKIADLYPSVEEAQEAVMGIYGTLEGWEVEQIVVKEI